MKNQTPRLNAKTVNANLYTGKHKFQFSRSRYKIQGRRQSESSGAQSWSGGTGEARSKGPRAGVVGEGAASLPPRQLGGLGSAVSSPSGVRGGAPGR